MFPFFHFTSDDDEIMTLIYFEDGPLAIHMAHDLRFAKAGGIHETIPKIHMQAGGWISKRLI